MPGATVDPVAVAAAIAQVRQRIENLSAGRGVRLVAVTKGFGVDAILAAMAAGCTDIGENYAQELSAKMQQLAGREQPDGGDRLPSPNVHFIGQLQTNKVRLVAGLVDVWQTVDRAGLVDEISRRAPAATVFVQVDVTGDAGKGGCAPDDVGDLVRQCRTAELQVQGLMTVGPTNQDIAVTRRAFTQVRCLADDNGLADCSMGMSGDMDLAIECGATVVRIGSALFGERPHPRVRIG